MHDRPEPKTSRDCESDTSTLGTKSRLGSFLAPSIVLAAVWILIILVVNPSGEFMVNDDWSFVRMLEALSSEGRLIATGWGKGGPSAIVHVLWGWLFAALFGFSMTTLRLSVLTLGVLGSFGLLVLLRRLGASPWWALLGALTLVFNPLFLAECFTFMTDITFVAFVMFSLLFLHLGVERSRTSIIVVGLVFALCSILTRQIGVVIPISFIAACFVLPQGRELGRAKMSMLAIAVTIVPWLSYEFLLYYLGSTPVTDHDILRRIPAKLVKMGLPSYLLFTFSQLFLHALGYLGFLVSPLLAARYWDFFRNKHFRVYFGLITAGFAATELASLTGLLEVPVVFHRNVIFNLGIGPVLLKDTQILKVQRTVAMGSVGYLALIYWATIAVGLLLGLFFSSVRTLLGARSGASERPVSFLGALSLLCAALYLGIIALTGFHDRYLIPVCAFLIIWLVPSLSESQHPTREGWTMLPGVVVLLMMGFFSTFMIHDFMAMKRSLKSAQDYVVNELNVRPCEIDGGFEFNSYHCYRKDFQPRKGLSWWWVTDEKYLLTLGSVPGYETVSIFPFRRYVGQDGAIHVLRPSEKAFDAND